MAQKIIMILLILIIVLGGGLYAYKELMPPPEVETEGPIYSTKPVTRGNISIGVETIGTLDPSNSGGLRVPGSMGRMQGPQLQYTIAEYFVKDGDIVQQGQVVARLEAPGLEDNIQQKQEEVQSKISQLAELCQVSPNQIDSINPMRGITIVSPIDGRVTDLNATEGIKLGLGQTIARIVDDSKFEIEAKLFPFETSKIKEGQEVVLMYPYFDGEYKGIVTHINPNLVPYMPENGEYAQSFVNLVTIVGENMGLIQRNMQVKVGVRTGDNSNSILYFTNKGTVTGFVKDENIINTIEAVVTKVHVDNMKKVSKGDPIITMAGSDIQSLIQGKLDEIRNLRNELSELNSQAGMLEVKAPMDGIVAGIYRQVGETVSAGEWIGHLYTVSDMRMWSMVDDIDILNVKQGAPVKVTVDAIPDKTFKGEVTYVSTMAEKMDNLSKFRIEIRVEGSQELRPGMQAKAYIDAGSAENVLLVPLEAIFEEDGKTMVEVLNEDGTIKVVHVKLGLMNDRIAEVKEGLTEGELVITGSSADLFPSQHIKTQGPLMPESTGDNGENGNKSGNK